MPHSIAVGFSQAENPKDAAHQAAVAVKNELNSITTDLVILFTSVHYAKKEVLDIIHTILKPKRLVGSSSFGLIVTSGIYKRGVAVLGINSGELQFGIGAHEYKPQNNARQIGFELSRQLLNDYTSPFPKRASILFYDSVIPYEGSFVSGAKEVLGYSSKVLVGFSCDDFKLRLNYQILQKKFLSKHIAGLIIGSEHPVVVSNKHSFKPLGKPRKVTSVKNNIIQTIDYKPAIVLYEEFLKKEADEIKDDFLNSPAMFYPLGIYNKNLGKYLLRYPLDILSDGSIVCQAEVPTEAEIHLMITNKDSCRSTATLIAQEVKDTLGSRQPQLLIVFNSMAKNKILGRYSHLELDAIQDVLGTSVPIIGMYTFGEVAPLGLNRNDLDSYLQNASMCLIAIS